MNTKPDVIVSDVHHRISGVSSTCRAVTPLIAKDVPTIFFGKHQLSGVSSTTSFWQLIKLLKAHKPRFGFYIWHARRNNEMQLALFAKHVLRLPIKIVFTSAAIRRHSWWPRQLIKAMDYVIATSSAAAAYVDASKIVPHGVDLNAFAPAPTNSEAFTVGIAGRVRPEKGTDLLVEAMLPILQSNPESRLLIAGAVTAKYKPYGEQLAAKLACVSSQVEWLGEQPMEKMVNFYQQLDVLCAPARYEGFGVVPIEAMACSTAIVASKTGAYPDMVTPKVGRLVDTDSVEQLSVALNELIANRTLLNSMKRESLAQVQKFDLKNEAAGIANAYQEMWSHR